jgi:cell wall assembly regulator SMI1
MDLLQAGQDPDDISSIFRTIGLEPTQELVALYSYHDGTEVKVGVLLDDIHYFPGFYWLSLGDAFHCYRAFRDDSRWHPSWVPIFANGGGDFYAVICDKTSKNFGAVVTFTLNHGHEIEFQSVSTFMETVSACYREGAYFLDNGWLEADDSAALMIAKRLNPDAALYSD